MSRRATAGLAAVGAVAAVILALFPAIDLWAAGLFWSRATGWAWFRHPSVDWLREISMIPTTVMALTGLIALIARLVRPKAAPILPVRAALLFLLVPLLAPVLLVNGVLKEVWDRSRPVHVQEFGGPWRFMPWPIPGDGAGCRTNCSFVSGEAAGAASLVAPALLAPPALRPYALAAAAAWTAVISVLRMAYGGHFLSDVLIASLITALIAIWLHRRLFARADADWERRLADLTARLTRRSPR